MSSLRQSSFLAVLAPLFLTLTMGLALAAQATPESAAAASPASYRVEYVIREYAGPKLINARHYDFVLEAPGTGKGNVPSTGCSVRVGSHVPVTTVFHQTQYERIGLNLDCQLRAAMPQGLRLQTTVSITSLVKTSLPGPESASAEAAPISRDISTKVDSFVAPDHPTTIASLDDIVSTHRFEIVVTAVPLP